MATICRTSSYQTKPILPKRHGHLFCDLGHNSTVRYSLEKYLYEWLTRLVIIAQLIKKTTYHVYKPKIIRIIGFRKNDSDCWLMTVETYKNIEAITAKNSKQWRVWLEANHASKKAIWLIIFKKESDIDSIYYPQAVDDALCYGWIDSKPNKRDDKSYYQYFSVRNPKSNWSKVNKEKVKYLIDQKLMRPPGLKMIATAKQNGTWDALNDVDNLILPPDLKAQFEINQQAVNHWSLFPDSAKRGILEWIFNAKRAETRLKRIRETVELAEKNIRANQYGG